MKDIIKMVIEGLKGSPKLYTRGESNDLCDHSQKILIWYNARK